MNRRKVEAKGPSVSDTASAGVGCEAVSGVRSSEGEARCFGKLGVGVDHRASFADQCSMRGAGGSQKKRKAAVRKDSAETQEYHSCQHNDIEADMDEINEELSFVPSAVSDSAGWHEPRCMSDRLSMKEGFKCCDIAAINGGRRRGAAHDKPLERLPQFEANREENTSGEAQAMEDCGR